MVTPSSPLSKFFQFIVEYFPCNADRRFRRIFVGGIQPCFDDQSKLASVADEDAAEGIGRPTLFFGRPLLVARVVAIRRWKNAGQPFPRALARLPILALDLPQRPVPSPRSIPRGGCLRSALSSDDSSLRSDRCPSSSSSLLFFALSANSPPRRTHVIQRAGRAAVEGSGGERWVAGWDATVDDGGRRSTGGGRG